MSVRFWEPGKAFLQMEAEVMGTIRDVLAAGDLVMRHQMEDFEHNLASFVGTSDAVGVSNCTDGMRLLLEAGYTPVIAPLAHPQRLLTARTVQQAVAGANNWPTSSPHHVSALPRRTTRGPHPLRIAFSATGDAVRTRG